MSGQKHTPSSRFVIALSADFEPEDWPGMTTMTFLANETGSFGAGLFEVRFVRTLTAEERAGTDAMLAAIAAAEPSA